MRSRQSYSGRHGCLLSHTPSLQILAGSGSGSGDGASKILGSKISRYPNTLSLDCGFDVAMQVDGWRKHQEVVEYKP